MSVYQEKFLQLALHDPRYPCEAYDFVYRALHHTQRLLGRAPRDDEEMEAGPEHHISGRELAEGVRDLALREFGLMARVVFKLWGINRTDDIGDIVFRLVEAQVLSKTDEDTRDEFHDVYDLDQALVQEYKIELDEAEWSR